MPPIQRLPASRQLTCLSHGHNSPALTLPPWTSPLNTALRPPCHHSSPSALYKQTPPQLRTLYGVTSIGKKPRLASGTPRPSTFNTPKASLGKKPIGARPELEILTPEMVPPLTFWTKPLTEYGSPLTPAQCHHAATLFCDGTKHRDITWSRRLLQQSAGTITPSTLHYMGIILDRHTPSTKNLITMGWSMLFTAHLLDYVPSTLELAQIWEDTRPAPSTIPPGKRAPDPIFMLRGPLTRFEAIVKTARDPNALVLWAERLAKDGKREEAMKFYLKARRVGMDLYPGLYARPPTKALETPRQPRWLKEATCHVIAGLELAKGELKKGEARAAFAFAALELDDAAGLRYYGELLPVDAPERRECFVRAAVSGVKAACQELAVREMERGKDEGLSEAERRWHDGVGKEWLALGGQ